MAFNSLSSSFLKEIKISIKKSKEPGKYRVSVFNTGKKIDEENLNRIWTRFYKIDESRAFPEHTRKFISKESNTFFAFFS